MPLIQLVEVLVVVGVLLWLVNRFIPMQGTIKSILNGVVVIALVLWILNAFGLFHSLSRIHIGKVAGSTVRAEVRADVAGAAREYSAVLFRPLATDRDEERPASLARRAD